MSYRELGIWQKARDLSVQIHMMSLKELPQFEMYETGRQIRRSCHSVRSNIVEGYGRRRYKQDFIRFLCYAESSCDETIDHLEYLYEAGSLEDVELYEDLHAKLQELAKMIHRFLASVERKHLSVREDSTPYSSTEAPDEA